MVTCNFSISIVIHNENWLLVFKNCAGRVFLALGPNGKTIRGPKKEESWRFGSSRCGEDVDIGLLG
jgi:hypothetical protein